jgi:hypothetical protein
LGWGVAQQTGWGLSLHLIAVIVGRIQHIKHRFSVLAARIAAGTYAPRRPAAALPAEEAAAGRQRPPPAKNPLPNQPGWLLKLDRNAVQHRQHLEGLFRDAEMVALMAAAPEAMARVLRPLCRMLALDLPPVLAPPKLALSPIADPPQSPAAAKPRRWPPSPPLPPFRPAPAPAPPSLSLAWPCGRPQLVWT